MSSNSRSKCRYRGLYKPVTPARMAFAAVLKDHLGIISRNRAGALKGRDSVHLHDIRVALRRMRGGLSFFSDLPGIKQTVKLDRSLKQLCMELGRMRDLQARLELLDDIGSGPDVNLEVYRQKCRRDIAAGMAGVQKTMSGAVWAYVISTASDLARSSRKGGGEDMSIRDYASARISDEFSKFSAKDFKGITRLSSESLHGLRKKCRKLRYNVELCAPALGARFVEKEHLLKSITQMLGRIHDVDVSLAFAEMSSDVKRAGSVLKVLQKDRRKTLKKLLGLLKKSKDIFVA